MTLQKVVRRIDAIEIRKLICIRTGQDRPFEMVISWSSWFDFIHKPERTTMNEQDMSQPNSPGLQNEAVNCLNGGRRSRVQTGAWAAADSAAQPGRRKSDCSCRGKSSLQVGQSRAQLTPTSDPLRRLFTDHLMLLRSCWRIRSMRVARVSRSRPRTAVSRA